MLQFHPLIAHLPVGLFMGAGLIAILGLFFKRGLFKEVIFWIIGIGVLATLPNIYLGIKETDTILPDAKMYELLKLHQRNAWVMLILFSILFFWLYYRRRIMPFTEYGILVIVIIFACSSAIYEVITGQELVYKHGANVVRTCPEEPLHDRTAENLFLENF